MITPESPRLIADIGGLYARFAIELERGQFTHQASLRCADHPSMEQAIRAYLDSVSPLKVAHAAIAVANPVEGDQVRMTNYHWQFSIEETRQSLGLDTLVVVNDFTALAMALPKISAADARQVGGGQPVSNSVIGLLGSGTGLGVSGLIPAGDSWISLGSEGGHTSFSPRDAREIRVLEYAWKQFDHVSFERLLSGSGLELIHQALASGPSLSAPEITRRALEQEDAQCLATLDVFCNMLGTAASNLAVTLGALGGIYIGGSIVPRLGEFFDRSGFRQRFEDKGRFRQYVEHIPTYVITAENPTFLGVSAILETQLRTLQNSAGSAILSQIRRLHPQLSPAEQRVADLVLAQPRSVLNDPIHDIALAAEVSQPTVIRFCRSVGCKGLSDFKLRLASGLSVSVPITHTQVTLDDSMLELGAKVLGNTANAVLQLRNELQRESIDKAIDLLAAAKRVEIFAVGNYAAVAQDAQMKLLRLGVPCGAHTTPHLQQLTAEVMNGDSLAIFISSGGNLPELLELQQKVSERGAKVLAITANQSLLAKRADAALVAEHNEHAATHLPMVSRVLHLLLVDILVVGLEMRRVVGKGADSARAASPTSPSAPGVRIATPLRPAISHSQ
ncbi:glucokinase [Limnohabitans radicicola]|uniref:glucokinase n=1 Tax=Limnohabitans radicicola TaxID=2771427 RepID=UPI001CD8C2B2|nr:glucokinase [Limnohabitans radicicola]